MKALNCTRDDAGTTPALHVSKLWDLGDEPPFPNLGKASCARILQAIIKLDGKILSYCDFGSNVMPDHQRHVVYRIALPVGSRRRFEDMTGYKLTIPPVYTGQ